MSISITTETEAAASLGLNPGDLLPPDDAASTRLNLTLETVELGRQEEAARREAARDFPWRHDKQVAYDQATLDLQMYRMLHEEAESPAKRETLGQYRDYRRRRGEESFTYLEAGQQRERDRNFRQQMPVLLKMFSGTEGFTSAFPDEQKQALEQTFASSLDPDADKRATANKMLVMAMTGRKVDPEGWPVLRTRYAQAAFGWQAPPASPPDAGRAGAASPIISEETFYQLAGQSLEQQKKEQEQSEEIFRRSMRAAFKGLPLDQGYTVAGEVAGDDSKRYEGAVRQGYAAILADYTDEEIRHGRELFEMFSKQENFSTDDVLPGGEFELTLAYARASQATRDKMMNVAWLNADAEAVDVTNYFSRLAAAMGYSARSMYDFLESGEIGRESAAFDRILEKGLVPTGTPVGDIRRLLKLRARDLERHVQLGIFKEWEIVEPGQRPKELQSLRWMTPEERKQMEDFRDLTKGVSLIAADSRTAGLRVKNYIDDKREGFWDTAGDWGVIGAESTVPMVFASASYGIGLPALIESNRVRNASNYRRAGLTPEQADDLALPSAILEAGIDRVQFLTLGAKLPAMQGWLLKWGRPGAVANFGLRWTGVGTMETGQELLQNFTAPAVQHLAAALNEDIKGVAWDEVIAREKAALGDTIGVSFGFALIFGGGSSVVNHMEASRVGAMLKDRDAIERLGIAPERARAIAERAGYAPASAAEMLKQAGMETSIAERQANAAAARERQARQQAEAAAQGDPMPDAAAAGLPEVQEQADGRIQITYPDRPAEIVPDREAAAASLRRWDENAATEITRANRSYLDFLTKHHEGGDAPLRHEGQQVDSLGTLGDIARGHTGFTQQALNRVRIAARQAGIEMGLDPIDLDRIPILGTSRNVIADGVTTIVTRIVRDKATPLTVIEEHAEGIAKYLMSRSNVGRGKMLGWLRDTEQRTGRKILPDTFDTASPTADQEIIEGWSYLAQANATGRIADSALPQPVKSFFRAFKEAIHASLKIAADFMRVRADLDPEFTHWLDVSAGIKKADSPALSSAPETNIGQMADASLAIDPLGPGARKITDAPRLLDARPNPFSGSKATTPKEWRAEWSRWIKANRARWEGEQPVLLAEGPVRVGTKARDHMKMVAKGENPALHFEAAVRTRELLEQSVLAKVEAPRDYEAAAAEIHRRYAWMTFADGKERNVLFTVKRWKNPETDEDSLYAVEALEVMEPGVYTGWERSENSNPPIPPGSGDTLSRFLAGIKPEHRETTGGPRDEALIPPAEEAPSLAIDRAQEQDAGPHPKILQATNPGTGQELHVFEAADGTRSEHATLDEAFDAWEEWEDNHPARDQGAVDLGDTYTSERHAKRINRHERGSKEWMKAVTDSILDPIKRKSSTGGNLPKGRKRKQLLGDQLELTPEERAIPESPHEITVVYKNGRLVNAHTLHQRQYGPSMVGYGEGHTFSHQHPSGKPPSLLDLEDLLRNPGQVLRIVARQEDGSIDLYEMRVEGELDSTEKGYLFKLFKSKVDGVPDTPEQRLLAMGLTVRASGGKLKFRSRRFAR